MSAPKVAVLVSYIHYRCPFCEWRLSTKGSAFGHLKHKHGITKWLVTQAEAAECVRLVQGLGIKLEARP